MAIFLISSTFAHPASFDCTKTSTQNEKYICTNIELGKLDEQMAYSYKKLFEVHGEILKSQQKGWIKYLRNCKDEACLIYEYKDRINDLERIKNKILVIEKILIKEIKPAEERYDYKIIADRIDHSEGNKAFKFPAGSKNTYFEIIKKNIGKQIIITYEPKNQNCKLCIETATPLPQ